MKIECVERRVKMMIRVEKVEDVRENKIRIKFDGWKEK
jgi:hypothetical protein